MEKKDAVDTSVLNLEYKDQSLGFLVPQGYITRALV